MRIVGSRHLNRLLAFLAAFGLIAGLFTVTAGVALAAPACGAHCYVSNTGNDTNDGATPGTSLLHINAGIAAVTAGGTVTVAAGTYPEFVQINKALTLEGANSG